MKSRGLLAAFVSVTLLGIAVGCSQPAVETLDNGDDDTSSKNDDVTKAPATKSNTTTTPTTPTATTPPAATTAPPAPTTTTPTTTPSTACADLTTCCGQVDNPFVQLACTAAASSGDDDLCSKALLACQLGQAIPTN